MASYRNDRKYCGTICTLVRDIVSPSQKYSHLLKICRLRPFNYIWETNSFLLYHIAGFLCGMLIFAFLQGKIISWKLIPIEWMCMCVLKKSCYNVIIFQLFTIVQRYTLDRPRIDNWLYIFMYVDWYCHTV